jgi:hypothetical protein
MIYKILISLLIFVFLLWFNYKGALGRIERQNQWTGLPERDLGSVSEKEDIAFLEGKHKQLALKQALIGALIWSIIIFIVLYYLF